MKKSFVTIILLAFITTLLVACGNSANVAESTADTVIETEGDITEPTAIPEQTEVPHEHVFTETITKEATCLEAGEKNLTCECGESSVEEVPATGHDFSDYVSNEDATYTADGTETATCTCGETDTRVVEGSMLTYTFEDMDATKYAKSTVNVRSLPNTDGEKLGGLSTNDEVKVTGKCTETGWYRIEYSDGIAYVSDEYLADEKFEIQASAPAQSSSEVFPYELYKVYGEGANVYAYTPWGGPATQDADTSAKTDATINTLISLYRENTGATQVMCSWESVGTYNNVLIVRRYCETGNW